MTLGGLSRIKAFLFTLRPCMFICWLRKEGVTVSLSAPYQKQVCTVVVSWGSLWRQNYTGKYTRAPKYELRQNKLVKISSNVPSQTERRPYGKPVKLNKNIAYGLWICWLEQAQHQQVLLPLAWLSTDSNHNNLRYKIQLIFPGISKYARTVSQQNHDTLWSLYWFCKCLTIKTKSRGMTSRLTPW